MNESGAIAAAAAAMAIIFSVGLYVVGVEDTNETERMTVCVEAGKDWIEVRNGVFECK